MSPTFLLRRMPRALGALLLVATLLLGAAAHLWHHVEEPHCGESKGAEHFCGACTNLHGGSLAAGDAPEPPAVRVTWAGFAAPTAQAPATAPRTAGAPRAPPAA